MDTKDKVILVMSWSDYEMQKKAYKNYRNNRLRSRERAREKTDVKIERLSPEMDIPEDLEGFRFEFVEGKLEPILPNLNTLVIDGVVFKKK